MRIDELKTEEIIKMFEDNVEVLKIIELCSFYFDKITEMSLKLANREVTSPNDCREILAEATAVFCTLQPILSIAEAIKLNLENQSFFNQKIETEKSGEKFVIGTAEKIASNDVANQRRVRNVLEGYVESSKAIISSSQSILKSMTDEIKMLPNQ